jgi:nucleotide-binding universal stress UspA family protein
MVGKPIVVAVDGSDEALRAAEWAAAEALRRNRPLRIVSAPAIPPRMHAYQGAASTVANALREVAADAVASAVSRVTERVPGLSIDTDILTGSPAAAVADSGAGAAMLVVGARGAGGFAAMLLGSVSRYAAVHASCPVVVVHEMPAAARREVIVGIREPESASHALGFAFEEAALREADLVAVHAWHWFPPTLRVAGDTVSDPELFSAQARQQLADMLITWQDKYPTVKSAVEVVHGHPGATLSSLSAGAELLVLGRRDGHLPPVRARVASVQHSVLGHAHGPVVIVPA